MLMRLDGAESHRSSGLHLPWDPLQVFSWVLIFIFVALFYTFNGLFLRPPVDIVLCVVYGVGALLTVLLNLITARSDAADPSIFTKLSDQEIFTRPIPPDRSLCQLCRAHVAKSSKHCGRCNKCVVGFDHHCKWLNNCIGVINYRRFFAFVTITLLILVFHFALGLYQFVDSFANPEFYATRLEHLYGGTAVAVFQAFDGFVTLLAFIAAALLVHLFGFHVMLAMSGQTTYEWIINRRNKKNAANDSELECSKTEGRPAVNGAAGAGDPQSRYAFYEPKVSGEKESGTPSQPEGESPLTGSEGTHSASNQSIRSSQRKNSSLRMVHQTPRSVANHDGGLLPPAPGRVVAGHGEEGGTPNKAHLMDALTIDLSLPMLPQPPAAHLRTSHSRRHMDTEEVDPLGLGMDGSGSARALDGSGGPGRLACCADVTELLLAQDSPTDLQTFGELKPFPELNIPQVDL